MYIFIIIYITILIISYWIFFLLLRKKEIKLGNKENIDTYLFSKYNNQLFVKDLTAFIIFSAFVVWIIIPNYYKSYIKLNERLSNKVERIYHLKYFELKNKVYQNFNSEQKKSFDNIYEIKEYLRINEVDNYSFIFKIS